MQAPQRRLCCHCYCSCLPIFLENQHCARADHCLRIHLSSIRACRIVESAAEGSRLPETAAFRSWVVARWWRADLDLPQAPQRGVEAVLTVASHSVKHKFLNISDMLAVIGQGFLGNLPSPTCRELFGPSGFESILLVSSGGGAMPLAVGYRGGGGITLCSTEHIST